MEERMRRFNISLIGVLEGVGVVVFRDCGWIFKIDERC